jgi:aminoglycoside N3'-acetyltransferase
MAVRVSRSSIARDISDLGVNKGDVLFVRADLAKIGTIISDKRNDYLCGILDVIGDIGTLVTAAFTPSSFVYLDKNYIFDGTNKPYTGALANLMLQDSRAIRSHHPTNSFVAIGKNAEYILDNHDENNGAYDPVKKIIELGGKNVIIGCVNSSPGLTSVHLAEIELGLHRRIILPTLNKVLYRKNGTIRVFKRKDIGSCSSAFYKFYAHYVYEEILKQGFIGNAYSIMVDAKKAYEIDLKVLKNNPRITICNDPACFLCQARRWDTLENIPKYVARYLYRKLFK